MKILIKDLDTLHVEEKLQRIYRDLRAEFPSLKTITSAFRPGDPGVHGVLPLRGIDIRCRDRAIGQYAAAHLNSRWSYDPSRPHLHVALYHDAGSGYHLHLQSHPLTVRKEPPTEVKNNRPEKIHLQPQGKSAIPKDEKVNKITSPQPTRLGG